MNVHFQNMISKLVLPAFAVLVIHTAASAQGYTPQEQDCYNMVQGKVAWDTAGSTGWQEGNVRALCRGTTDAAATVACFRTNMPQLGWAEATKQCAGPDNAIPYRNLPAETRGDLDSKFPGKASDIDAKNGVVWMVGNTATTGGREIFRLDGSRWTKVDGGAVRIAVDGTGTPWIIDENGAIFRRNNDTWNRIVAPTSGKPLDIAIAASGEVWIVKDDDSAARFTGSGWSTLITFTSLRTVTYIPGQDIFQLKDASGRIYYRQSPTSWVTTTDATGLAGKYNDYAVDTNGTKWAIGSDFSIYRFLGTPTGFQMPVIVATPNSPPLAVEPITPRVPSITKLPPVAVQPTTPSAPRNLAIPTPEDPEEIVPPAPRVITTWNKAGYLTRTNVYRLDKATDPTFYASDGPPNHLAGESPKITVGAEVPMNVPLQARVYTFVGIGEAVESYRGTIGANIDTGCFSARGTTMKPIVEPCPDGVAVESRHITFANEAGYTAQMYLSYFVDQTANGVSTPLAKTVDTGLTALGYRRKIYIPEDALPNMPVTLSIKAFGTNKQDLFSQTLDMARSDSPCYMVKGLLLNPSYETCSGDDAFLPDEKKAEYILYEHKPPVLSDADMQLVMNWIAAKMTAQLTPFCWKPIYANGAGYPLNSCPPGQEREGVLCYPKCNAGYAGNLDRCGMTCPTGFADIGLFCQKPAPYGRGGGHAWIWGDPAFDYSKAKARCEKENPQGCESDTTGGIWYPKCKAGFHAVGTNICSPDCPSGWNDTGTGCTKPTYYRGAGTPMGCGPGYEQSGGLCYPACRAGYKAVATNCTQKCPSQQPWDCGAACTTDQTECGLTVANQVVSPILLVITIATLGTDEVVEAPVKDAALGAEHAAITAAKGTSKLKNAYQLVKTSLSGGKAKITAFLKNTDTYKGLGANFIGKEDALALKGPIVSAIGGETRFYQLFQQTPNEFFTNAKLTVKVAAGLKTIITTIRNDALAYNMLFVDNFEHNTSKEINDMIDKKFPNPIGRYQVKKQWAIQNLEMLLNATMFNQTEATLGVASIIDPSGVFSVVGAYTHPMCGEDVPFPTQLTLRHNL